MRGYLHKIRWPHYLAVCLMAGVVLAGGFLRARLRTQSPIIIHWITTHQVIDGFGASATGYVGKFPDEEASQFFDVEKGLGLSLLRLAIVPGLAQENCRCVANNSHYGCVAGSKSQILSGDLRVAQLAVARGVRVMASPWSPPAEMKSSGEFCGGGAMKGEAGNYARYAEDLADFPMLLKANGVAIDAISVQNEPDVENSGYDTARWTGQQVHDFIPYLSAALTEKGLGGIKIGASEESEWTFDRLQEAMSDPAVASRIGIVMGHAYRTERPSGLPESGGRHVWQTEVSDYSKFDGSMTDGLLWANYIHNYLTIGTNAWLFWSLDCREEFYNQDNNMCLTDKAGHFAKRAYVLGQYAKFVRPGWQRIGVANRGGLLVTAYRGPQGGFAVVAVNPGIWPARNQTFEFSGTTCRTAIRPWLTSANASLEEKAAISPASDGASFTYTIPARSVITFEGRAD